MRSYLSALDIHGDLGKGEACKTDSLILKPDTSVSVRRFGGFKTRL